MTACLTGCTLRDRHLTTCEGICWGCLPRAADDGRTLCKRCCSRLAGAVARAPGLIEHLRSIKEPGAAMREDVKRGKEMPPIPMNAESASDADNLHNILVSWCLALMEEEDLTGPDMDGTRWAKRGSYVETDGETVWVTPGSVTYPAGLL